MTVSINARNSLNELGISSQRFTNKDDIKPWLQNILLDKKGINVVIARSDANKIIFRCKSGKNKVTLDGKASRRQISCPFKIRANYSIRNNIWTLVVINEEHDHELSNFGSLHQNKFAYLFGHRKNDEPGSNDVGVIDSTSPVTSSSKSNSSDVFSTFMPSSDMTSPLQNNDTLADSMAEIKDSVNVKENSENTRLTSSYQEQSRKRKFSKEHKYQKNATKDDTTEHIQDTEKDNKIIVNDLREQINGLISNAIVNNQSYTDKEKSLMLKSLFSRFINDYKCAMNTVTNQSGSSLNSWLNTPTATQQSLHSHASTNLIPLSPLLNDTDTEYNNTTPNNHSNSHTLENLTQLPNMTLGSNLMSNIGTSNSNANNNYNNLIIPPQMQLLQIQNQSQQLPSFNTIQNQLPLSPTSLANNSTASLFVNNFNSTLNSNSSSLIPPINNSSTNTTLNPSHLLKSSNKNSVFNNGNHSSPNTLFNRNELKQNGSSNPINSSGTSTTMFSNPSLTPNVSSSNYVGLSSPNNNMINQNSQNNSTNTAYYNKETIFSGNNHSNQPSAPSSNANGGLSHISSLNDNGW